MSNLVLGTDHVTPDDACYSLKEVYEQSPGSRGFHRYQIIKVLRSYADQPLEFRRDLGPIENWTGAEQFTIIGGGANPATGKLWAEETVGGLMDMADHMREGPYQKPATPEPTDLIKLYHDEPDKQKRRLKAVSQFGPVAAIIRS